FLHRIVHDTERELALSQVDPLVQAGWRALLFMAFGAVLILSCLGFLVHAYVSFREREMQFGLMRTIGFSMRQLITLVWVEQALVITAGMALGAEMGRRLGAIIMPFLSHNDRGGQVLPPFVLEIDWGTLGITYGFMILVFTAIILGMIWFIRRISLQKILRLGEV
ncbi:MAG: ABC transporter permease, partial [Chloroflexi bacterium]|nr:ABC transporter permease [Chloroflexota bacterium]